MFVPDVGNWTSDNATLLGILTIQLYSIHAPAQLSFDPKLNPPTPPAPPSPTLTRNYATNKANFLLMNKALIRAIQGGPQDYTELLSLT